MTKLRRLGPNEVVRWVEKNPSVRKSVTPTPARTSRPEEVAKAKTEAENLVLMLQNREQQEKAPADLTDVQKSYLEEQRARFARE